MRPERMEMWSKDDLIDHIYHLENQLQVYADNNKEDHLSQFVLLFKTTGKESAVLMALMDGRIHTKENLLSMVYIDQPGDLPEPKIIDVFICKLRKKVAKWGVCIETCWGRGYRLQNSDLLKEYLAGSPLVEVAIPEKTKTVGVSHADHEETGANMIAVFQVIKEIFDADPKGRVSFTSRTISSRSGVKTKVAPFINKLHKQGYIRIIKRPDPYDPFASWKVDLLKNRIGIVSNLKATKA